MGRISLILAIAAFAWTAQPAAAQEPPQGTTKRFKGWVGPKPEIDCTCRRPGGAKTPLGEVVCLERDGKRVRARCEMPQNMPFWRILGEGCEDPIS